MSSVILSDGSRKIISRPDFSAFMYHHYQLQAEVITEDFLGGGSTKKCNHNCDQALIKSSWGSV